MLFMNYNTFSQQKQGISTLPSFLYSPVPPPYPSSSALLCAHLPLYSLIQLLAMHVPPSRVCFNQKLTQELSGILRRIRIMKMIIQFSLFQAESPPPSLSCPSFQYYEIASQVRPRLTLFYFSQNQMSLPKYCTRSLFPLYLPFLHLQSGKQCICNSASRVALYT